MKKIIKRGEMIPPFYGIGYRCYVKDESWCYPIPLNLFVLLYFDFIWWLKNPKE